MPEIGEVELHRAGINKREFADITKVGNIIISKAAAGVLVSDITIIEEIIKSDLSHKGKIFLAYFTARQIHNPEWQRSVGIYTSE